ncbi:hypothetical protein LSTR_LSTR003015 [Laodelphax striatellus]|uniref:Uncharacterized protein n=1 Tax=Laodelphax striatellus TaxID=195883 RepID=A0A482XU46_LAOST|nr:hypothetical protein LSTR_LSTR003015 [Laodelphax striatellus]
MVSTVFANLKIVMADTNLDWKGVIEENVKITPSTPLTKKLIEVLLDSPVKQPKDVEVDDTPPRTGLFNRFDALAKDIGQNRVMILKPLAFLEKIKSTVMGKEAEDGESDKTTPNTSNNGENHSSHLDKLTNTKRDVIEMDKKGDENVGRTLKIEEKSSNLVNQDSRSILDKQRNTEKGVWKTDNEDENVGKTSKTDEISSNIGEKSPILGDSESSIAKTLVKEEGDHEIVEDISKNIDSVPSFLKNIESKVMVGEFGDEDPSIKKSNLSFIEKIEPFSNEAVEGIHDEQNIENTPNIKSSFFEKTEDSGAEESILVDKEADQQLKNIKGIEKESDQWLFGNMENSANKPVEENENVESSVSNLNESSLTNLIREEEGKEGKRENRGGNTEEGENGEEEKGDEGEDETLDTIDIPRTLQNEIFDPIKTENDAIREVNEKYNLESGENEEDLEKKTLSPPLNIRMFSAFDVDKVDNRINDERIDKIGDKSSTQETIHNQGREVDSKNDSIFKRVMGAVWSNIRSLLKFLVEILKIYCHNRYSSGFENNDKKKVYLPQDLEVFPTFELGR